MVNRKAFHTLSYGLYVISSKDEDGKRVGCIANTLVQVASEPPMVSVSLNKENATTKAIAKTKRFCASVLAETATMQIIGRFGFHSSYDIEKFEGVESSSCAKDIPYLNESCVARFAVDVEASIDAGTHIVFVGKVDEAELISDGKPLTYSYYHKVLKGKTPPKAASYDEEPAPDGDDAGSTEAATAQEGDPGEEDKTAEGRRYGWRCTICGYIVEADELPDDFTCPICGVGKSLFEKIEL